MLVVVEWFSSAFLVVIVVILARRGGSVFVVFLMFTSFSKRIFFYPIKPKADVTVNQRPTQRASSRSARWQERPTGRSISKSVTAGK